MSKFILVMPTGEIIVEYEVKKSGAEFKMLLPDTVLKRLNKKLYVEVLESIQEHLEQENGEKK